MRLMNVMEQLRLSKLNSELRDQVDGSLMGNLRDRIHAQFHEQSCEHVLGCIWIAAKHVIGDGGDTRTVPTGALAYLSQNRFQEMMFERIKTGIRREVDTLYFLDDLNGEREG